MLNKEKTLHDDEENDDGEMNKHSFWLGKKKALLFLHPNPNLISLYLNIGNGFISVPLTSSFFLFHSALHITSRLILL